jgi:hypothetical protein
MVTARSNRDAEEFVTSALETVTEVLLAEKATEAGCPAFTQGVAVEQLAEALLHADEGLWARLSSAKHAVEAGEAALQIARRELEQIVERQGW